MSDNSKQHTKTEIKRLEDNQLQGLQQLTKSVRAMNDALANGGKMTPRLRQLIDRCDVSLV